MTYSEKIELLSGLADLTQTILKLTKIVANIQPDGVRPTIPEYQLSALEELKKASPEEKISVVKDFLQTYLDSDDDPVIDDKDDEPIPPTTKIVNMIPFDLHQFVPYGSDIRCTRPTKDREYIRILKVCRGKFLTVKHIFPNVKNPDRYELITLQRLGYLQRYTEDKYVLSRWRDGKVREARKVWFKTTPKGEELLRKVGV
ncbi:MAG: hypothetical protein K6C34_02360 [Alphaproteobacteria bacterium]|nr:hypothetical protein [Alphaproteobacteria bacterium]